jgi:hypothetical protein
MLCCPWRLCFSLSGGIDILNPERQCGARDKTVGDSDLTEMLRCLDNQGSWVDGCLT